MCILELRKVPMYKLHDDYTKSKYGNKSRLLFTDIDNSVYETFDDFSKNKEIKNLSNYSAKSKYYDDLNQLAVSKMAD